MRLAEFILANLEPILAEWDRFASSLESGATMTKRALRDDGEAILLATVRDMEADQSHSQQASKSKGHGGADTTESDGIDNVAERHANERVRSGFAIVEMVSEYRALRATVLRLWRTSLPQPDRHDTDDVTRFNESIDQSLSEAVGAYTERVERSRQVFLAILGHDLRNPMHCIRMAAHLLSQEDESFKPAQALAVIDTESSAMAQLISDLLDFASTWLGKPIRLRREQVDLQRLCREVLDGFRVLHPQRTLGFHTSGDLTGQWDAARLRQVVSNLMGNAIRHGSPEGPVELSVTSDGMTATLIVHNEGEPIPVDLMPVLFEPLMLSTTLGSELRRAPDSVGLGLYIVREIVIATGGTIEVASTAEEGTTFTVRIPHQRTVDLERSGAKSAR